MEIANHEQQFADVKARLDEIVEAVNDENLPLDDALALYEEAVTLGLGISNLLEENIEIDEEDAAEQASAAEQPKPGSAE